MLFDPAQRHRKRSDFSTLELEVLRKAEALIARRKAEQQQDAGLSALGEVFTSSPRLPLSPRRPPVRKRLAQAGVVAALEHAEQHGPRVRPSHEAGCSPKIRQNSTSPRNSRTEFDMCSSKQLSGCNLSSNFSQLAEVRDAGTLEPEDGGSPEGAGVPNHSSSCLQEWEIEEIRGACREHLKQWLPGGGQDKRGKADLSFPVPMDVVQRLCDFIDNDGAGIGKAPVDLSTRFAVLKEDRDKKSAAALAAAQAQAAAALAAQSQVAASQQGGRLGSANPSGGGLLRANRTGKGTGENANNSRTGTANSRLNAQGVAPAAPPSAGNYLGQGGAGSAGVSAGAAQLPANFVPLPDMTAAEVIDWLFSCKWEIRTREKMEKTIEKFYLDAQNQLNEGKDAAAAKQATLVRLDHRFPLKKPDPLASIASRKKQKAAHTVFRSLTLLHYFCKSANRKVKKQSRLQAFPTL